MRTKLMMTAVWLAVVGALGAQPPLTGGGGTQQSETVYVSSASGTSGGVNPVVYGVGAAGTVTGANGMTYTVELWAESDRWTGQQGAGAVRVWSEEVTLNGDGEGTFSRGASAALVVPACDTGWSVRAWLRGPGGAYVASSDWAWAPHD